MKLVPSEVELGKIKVPISVFVFFDDDGRMEFDDDVEEEELQFAIWKR